MRYVCPFDPGIMNTDDASLSGGVAFKSMKDNQLLEVMFLVLVEKKGRLIGCGRSRRFVAER